jgi:hypothetical protein
MMRLLRLPHIGRIRRSFRLHKHHYARETIAECGYVSHGLKATPDLT